MTTEPSNDLADRFARAEAAYAAGDFAAVRVQCAALGGAGDPETASRVRALVRRVDPDLAAWIAISVSLALFVGIVVAYAV